MRLFSLLGVAISTIGCAANLKAITSGRIGCPESEIEIVQDEGDSWTAVCRGQTYYCSSDKGTVSGIVGRDLLIGTTSGNQMCTADSQSSPAARPTVDGQEDRRFVRSVNPPGATAPSGAMGFELDASPDVAKEACTAARYEWTGAGDAYACSGTPKSIGLAGRTRIRSCNAKVCEIDLLGRPAPGDSAGWTAHFARVADTLKQKYGDPNTEERKIPSECRSSLAWCVKEGKAFITYQWIWSKEQYILLTLRKVEGEPAIEIVYKHLPSATVPKIDNSAL